MGFFSKLFGGDSAKKAAEEQAKAIREQAAMQQKQMQEQSAMMQQSQEQMIANQRAAEEARRMEQQAAKPQEVEVDMEVDRADIDPETGRRRPPRQAFMSNRGGSSGIKI